MDLKSMKMKFKNFGKYHVPQDIFLSDNSIEILLLAFQQNINNKKVKKFKIIKYRSINGRLF